MLAYICVFVIDIDLDVALESIYRDLTEVSRRGHFTRTIGNWSCISVPALTRHCRPASRHMAIFNEEEVVGVTSVQ